MSWRLLVDEGVGAAAGLACDELLAQRVGAGSSPPSLRLYSYRPHAVLVGRFQDVEREVDLEQCAQLGLELNRRPTGGGAILMGPDQLGVALALRGRGAARDGSPRELMQRFSDGLVRALGELDIDARFRGKNDLEVGGRKLAGLGVHRALGGGLLFHASLLIDLDVELMTRVLRTPFAELGAAERATVGGRTTSVRQLVGSALSVDELRARIAAGFADSFEVATELGALEDDEVQGVERLARERYETQAWVFQRPGVPRTDGKAELRTLGGGIEARVALSGRTLQAVHFGGDLFAEEGALADLEGRLRWHAAEGDALAETVGAWARAGAASSVGADDVLAVLLSAIEHASAQPYGCFVSPGGGA